MKKLLSLFVALIYIINVNAQFAVTTNSGSGLATSYTSLANAITALNAAAITSPVVITCPTGTETSPAGGYSITASGTSTNTITIVGNGAANSIITAPTTHTIGDINDAIIKIIGGDYITIDGFGMFENAANTTTTSASNNMTEFGIALFYSGTTAVTANGSQNCIIKNNTIDLDKTYQNTFGIYCNSNHTATSVAVTVSASTVAGNNSNLTITGNSIADVNQGIIVIGSLAAGIENDGLTIGGSLSDANTITNYGTTGTFSGFIAVSGSVNGILVRAVKNFNISFNSISTATGPSAGSMRAIYIPAPSNAPVGTITNNVNNNEISIKTGVVNGALQGIFVETIASNATTTLNINNNNFSIMDYSVANPTGIITVINNTSPALNTNINNNTFTNLNTTTTGSYTFISNSLARPANAVTNANNNAIVTAFSKTGAGGTVLFYNSSSTTPSGTETNTGNNFSNVTLTGATLLNGFQSSDGPAAFGPSKTITNNIFDNITGGTSALTIMRVGFSASSSNISGNRVSNISGAGTVIGISYAGGNENLFNNTVHTLSSTGAFTVTGITITGATTTQNIYKNKIYNLTANNAAGFVRAITVANGLSTNIYNNVISDLKAPSTSNSLDAIIGINLTSAVVNSNINIYHNSILINASGGANFATSAILHTYNATSTTAALNLRNNIIINKSTPSGTGRTVAFRRSAATDLNNYNTNSNNNIFYAGTPSANKLIFYDGTNSDQTLAAFKMRVTTRETDSKTEDVPFQSTTGSNANFLRIALGAVTVAESGAIATTPATSDDYWGIARPFASPVNGGTANDIGASEFDGIPCGAGKWVGGASTAWNLPSNWCDGVVPTNASNVIIPSGAPNQPNISVASPAATTNNININTGATLTVSSGGLYEVTGAITNTGTLNTAAGDVSFVGTTTQTPPALTVNNFVVNNAAGVTPTGAITVNGALSLTNGILTTTASNLLTLADGATSTAAIATSFVNGPLKKTGNDNFIFPIGKTGTSNRIGECRINNTSGTITDEFTAEYFPTAYSNLTVSGALTAIDSAEYWDIKRTLGSSTPNVSLYWKDGVFSGIPGTINSSNITVGHFNSMTTFWENLIYATHTGDRLTGGSVTTNAVSNFSPFTIGLIAGTLPLAVNSFTASKQNSNTNAINWKATCTGASVSFELQRSTNGIIFTAINTLTATQARCAAPFNYIDNYNATSPITYYKLKVMSNTGEVKYSQITAINNKNAVVNTIALYPNITKGNAVLVVESKTTTNVNFVITDAKGAIIRRFTENLSEGANAYPINVSNLSVGSYQITGIIDGALKTIRFIKE